MRHAARHLGLAMSKLPVMLIMMALRRCLLVPLLMIKKRGAVFQYNSNGSTFRWSQSSEGVTGTDESDDRFGSSLPVVQALSV